MRTRFSVLSLLLVLTACGGDTVVTTCPNAYWEREIGLCISEGWRVVDRTELDERGVSEEAVIAFQSDRPYAGQFATVVVTREVLTQTLTTVEYSDASILSVSGLPEYSEVDRRAIIVDGFDIVIHIFSAKPRTDALAERFFQVSAVSQNMGYTVTAATPVSVDPTLETQVIDMLSSITFIPPDGEASSIPAAQ